MTSTYNQSVCVVGTGARTAVGLTAPATAAAVRAGIAVMAEHPYMIDKMGNPMLVCMDSTLPVELPMIERYLELAISAAKEALATLLKSGKTISGITVLLALPEKRPGIPDNFRTEFSRRFATALASEINIQELYCYLVGHAGGFYCMEQALTMLGSGHSQYCLVGGIESYLEPETLEWLDDQEQLHSETTIWGFCPGEGAGFCLLTTVQIAISYSLPVLIELLSASSATEPCPIKTETVCIGQGLSEAFKKSLECLQGDSKVNYTICDMNGEPYRGNEYGFSVLRSSGKFADDEDFMTPADCWGDVGAASGLLFAILAAFAAQKQYAPGPNVLVWASSEGGLRGAALMRATNLQVRH
jgi:3-oxoacyl-[acyl-carrier-protein] synthase-1